MVLGVCPSSHLLYNKSKMPKFANIRKLWDFGLKQGVQRAIEAERKKKWSLLGRKLIALRIFANGVAKKNLAESVALLYRLEVSSLDFQVFILPINLIKNTKLKPYIAWWIIDGIFEYKKEINNISMRNVAGLRPSVKSSFQPHTHSHRLCCEKSVKCDEYALYLYLYLWILS